MPFLNLKFTIQKPLICWNCHDLKCHLLNASQMYDAKLLVRLQSIFSQEKKKNLPKHVVLYFPDIYMGCCLKCVIYLHFMIYKWSSHFLFPNWIRCYCDHIIACCLKTPLCLWFLRQGSCATLSYFLTGLFITLTLWPLPCKS